MNTPRELVVRSAADLSSVTVTRGSGVPNVFWSRAVAEWGSSGSRGGNEIIVPLERFLSQLGWVRPACITHLVEIDFDEATRELIQRGGKERRALAAARTSAAEPIDVDDRLLGSRFRRDLRPFQKRDLARLLAMPNGANFSVPGAGKTAVTYALYEAERMAGRVERLLVVAPLSAFEAWADERKECFQAPIPKLHNYAGGRIPAQTEICVVNYQRLALNYRALAHWVAEKPTHVVLDEAHRAKKGWAGEWGRACLSLAFLASRRDLLTGTPAPQGFKDLEALFDFTWPGLARTILPSEVYSRGSTLGVAERVAEAIAPLFVRTTKSDLKLPEVSLFVQPVPLTGLQREIYSALKNEYAGELAVSRRDRFDFARMGEIVMYLLEAATNPQLLSAGSSEYDPPEFKHPPLEVPVGTPLKELLSKYSLYETPPQVCGARRNHKEERGAWPKDFGVDQFRQKHNYRGEDAGEI